MVDEEAETRKIIGLQIEDAEAQSIFQEFRLFLSGGICFSSGDSWLLKGKDLRPIIGSGDIDRLYDVDDECVDHFDKKIFSKIRPLINKKVSDAVINDNNLTVVFDNGYRLNMYCTTAEGYFAPIQKIPG